MPKKTVKKKVVKKKVVKKKKNIFERRRDKIDKFF